MSKPSKKLTPITVILVPPVVQPSLGYILTIHGLPTVMYRYNYYSYIIALPSPTTLSLYIGLLPCFELLCTNIESDDAIGGPDRLSIQCTATYYCNRELKLL